MYLLSVQPHSLIAQNTSSERDRETSNITY